MIYNYQKISDTYTTYQANLPEGAQELATIGDVTYVFSPTELPAQPEQLTVVEVTLSDELREAIKAASPHCQLIYDRMEAKIRERYAADDEIFLTRIGVGQALGVYQMTSSEQAELMAYQAIVEGVRQWGRERRAELGL
jgi:phosphate uptake regulator